MSTHQANAAHPDQTHADITHPAAELAANAQAAVEQAARPEIQAPEHANENQLAPALDGARPPVKPPENILPPDVNLPTPPTLPIPTLPTTATEMLGAMPPVFNDSGLDVDQLKAAETKLLAGFLPSIPERVQQGLTLEIENEPVAHVTDHKSVGVKITLEGKNVGVNHTLLIEKLMPALLTHPILSPLLEKNHPPRMSHVIDKSGHPELQIFLPAMTIASYEKLINELAHFTPQTMVSLQPTSPDAVTQMASATAPVQPANDNPLTQVSTPAEHQQTVIAPENAVSM